MRAAEVTADLYLKQKASIAKPSPCLASDRMGCSQNPAQSRVAACLLDRREKAAKAKVWLALLWRRSLHRGNPPAESLSCAYPLRRHAHRTCPRIRCVGSPRAPRAFPHKVFSSCEYGGQNVLRS